ncbi:MAG: hypothetical protein UHD05_03160, partial [Ruminococcus sp.]|nr:hypothetical protein [Ruminococcus sp.]
CKQDVQTAFMRDLISGSLTLSRILLLTDKLIFRLRFFGKSRALALQIKKNIGIKNTVNLTHTS